MYYVALRRPWRPRATSLFQGSTNNSLSIIMKILHRMLGILLCLGKKNLLSMPKTNIFNKDGEELPMEPNIATIINNIINHHTFNIHFKNIIFLSTISTKISRRTICTISPKNSTTIWCSSVTNNVTRQLQFPSKKPPLRLNCLPS